MNGPFTSVAIGLPLDRQVEIGRFVFAATGGAYRFTMEPARGGFEVVAEWCEQKKEKGWPMPSSCKLSFGCWS